MRSIPRQGNGCGAQKTSGPIGGGVITYAVNGEQKVAVATGFTAILWPTEVVAGQIVILGFGDSAKPWHRVAAFLRTPRSCKIIDGAKALQIDSGTSVMRLFARRGRRPEDSTRRIAHCMVVN